MSIYIEAIKTLIEPIVDNIENIQIREIENENGKITILIMASSEYLSRLIGKKGLIIDAIRRLINVKATHHKEYIRVNIEEFN